VWQIGLTQIMGAEILDMTGFITNKAFDRALTT